MFLPWRGMFEQVMLADLFIFYDDVQLPKGGGRGRSFQTRVQIKTENGWRWLSLPVNRTQSSTLLIKDAKFAHQDWRRSHLDILKINYRRSPYFRETFDLVKDIYSCPTESLAEFCVAGMRKLFSFLQLTPKIYLSSELGIATDASGSRRVLEHCLHFAADKYITGLGARNYIDCDMFENAGVKIYYMDYSLKPYPQINGPFNPFVSVIDLLFNVGPNFKDYLGSEAKYWKSIDVNQLTPNPKP
jgi:hypothetical protein